jgi:hypothetical protein
MLNLAKNFRKFHLPINFLNIEIELICNLLPIYLNSIYNILLYVLNLPILSLNFIFKV